MFRLKNIIKKLATSKFEKKVAELVGKILGSTKMSELPTACMTDGL